MARPPIQQQFEAIYHATYRYAKAYTLARIRDVADTDDLLQVVYTALYRRMLTRGVPDETAARKLLTTSIKHELTRYYGRRRRERGELHLQEVEGDALERLLQEQAPALSADDRMTLDEVWRFLQGQGDLVQRLFLLYFQMGYTLRECAQLLDMSESAATARLYRTLQRLRVHCADMGKGGEGA